MTTPRQPNSLPRDSDDQPSNPTDHPTIGELIAQRMSRRQWLGLAAAAAASQLPTGCASPPRRGPSTLQFTEIDNHLDGHHRVAAEFDADVLIRWGDPVHRDSPAFSPDRLTRSAQEKQFGYNNDFVGFLPLPLGSRRSDHGLLCVNHEYGDPQLMFRGAVYGGPLTAEQVAVDMAACGHSVIEVVRRDGRWGVVEDSEYARRITATTPISVSGPAAGHRRLQTAADPTGRRVLGTLNNCAGGVTPWGTVLVSEENFNQHFVGDPTRHPEAEKLERYGFGNTEFRWGDHVDRFDHEQHPNEVNRYGWVVEFDPHDPDSVPVKRTALGRFKHEGATTVLNPDGRVVVYMGDDERFDYVYRFVTAGRHDPDDREANRDLLDHGTLSVARFDADGTLEWLPLIHGQGPLTEERGFASQADILIDCRLAADAVGATRMDRPEDVEPDPHRGRVYVMLTNNTDRSEPNPPNTRSPNPWGQVIEMLAPRTDDGFDHTAPRFTWDLLLRAGNPAIPNHDAHYHPDVSRNGWLACPDNAAIDPDGRLWITTDGASKHGLPDGVWATDVDGPGRALTRFFFACPRGAEMCGPCFTPDGETLFVAVQHPGEEDGSTFERPSTRWPDFEDGVPPRPSIVAITRKGGGAIG